MVLCIFREEGAWRRGGGEETSSWRDSRREESDRGERRDIRDRRDDRDRDLKGPQRDNDEGQRFMIYEIFFVIKVPHAVALKIKR